MALPLLLGRVRRKAAYAGRGAWLARLGLDGKGGRRTGELSGGEAQRVAVARALVDRAEGPVRRRADRLAGLADRREGDGPADRPGPGGGHDRGAGHPRRPGRRLRRPRGRGARRPGRHAGAQRNATGACADDPARPAARAAAAAGRRSPAAAHHGRGRARRGRAARRARRVPRLPGRRQPAVLGVHAGRRPAAGRLGAGARPASCGTTARTSTRAGPSSGSTWPRWVRAPRSRPGVSRLPGAGQYYASPALAALLRTVPPDELGDRFPGTHAGTIGDAALSGPDELAISSATRRPQLAAVPGTRLVTTVAGRAGPGRCSRRSSGTRSASACSRCCSRC